MSSKGFFFNALNGNHIKQLINNNDVILKQNDLAENPHSWLKINMSQIAARHQTKYILNL